MFSGFHLTGLPELLSTSHKVEITSRTFLKRILGRTAEADTNLCVWEWKKSRQMEQHNGPTSLNSPSPNPGPKSTQLPRADRKDNWSWNRFSSHKIETSRAQFPLTGSFGSLLDGRAVEANRTRRDESGKGAAFVRSPAKPTVCHARCFLHDVTVPTRNEGLGATVRVRRNDIICEPSCVVWQQSRTVLLPLESWTPVNPISQWVRTGG